MKLDSNQPRVGDYEPIDCGFHDALVSWATLQQPVEVVYRSETGEETIIQDRIADVYTREGAEYVKLQNGQIIRLDMLRHVEEI